MSALFFIAHTSREILVGKQIILDFDLDFYSTRNPLLSLYNEINLHERLKPIYEIIDIPPQLVGDERLSFALNACKQGKELLDNLDGVTNDLAKETPINSDESPVSDFRHQFNDIQEAFKQEYGENEKIDWKQIHLAGCTLGEAI